MDIDIVIPWVDGSDPAWQAEKAKYSGKRTDDSDSVNRYRDWGLMPYWFRSIESYAPWVRMIHFVTWGHVPAFLNIENPKLHIVNHKDFIPAEYLPTFSSHVIELNVHRIPDLSEQFILMNDDTFIIRNMSESAFFQRGLPCTYGGEVPIHLSGSIGTWLHAAVNDLGVVNAHFPKREATALHRRKYVNSSYRWQDNLRTWMLEELFPDYFTGFKNLHAPAAYLKSTFQDVWDAEPEILDSTCRNRFRSNSDVNQWVMLWWQVASGTFMPYNTDNVVMNAVPDSVGTLCEIIRGQKHDMLCINDPDGEEDTAVLMAQLKDAFSAILPEKCSFEK